MIDPLLSKLAPPWAECQRIATTSQAEPLTIALINNMPDSALRATELQFCRLLKAASSGMVINLKFYSPPHVARSVEARAHIAQHYEEFSELKESSPDAIIVTGAAPTAARLQDEACWEPISQLADWAIDRSIPGIWSCLASHVAVLHLDGINRLLLPKKASGIFKCRINRASHQIIHGLPASWNVPHSRMNELPERELISHGYAILSKSYEIGVDIFSRKQGAIQLFFQGHPEYDAGSLAGEFRRDVRQYLEGKTNNFPCIPANYFCSEVEGELQMLSMLAQERRSSVVLSSFDAHTKRHNVESQWVAEAIKIYRNWLSYVANRRATVTWASFFLKKPPLLR